MVLAAALRAYVPLVDPHGAWAPLEEEWSLYTEDPGFDAGPRLWSEITRTALGARITGEATPPLAAGDLVLSVDGVPTAAMPLEQVEQLGRVLPSDASTRRVLVLRGRETRARELEVSLEAPDGPEAEESIELASERVPYGSGRALLVRIPEVPEDLGERLGRLLERERDAALSGVLLDLRGNGGGSTEAAAAALGLFLPGAPLFPLAAHGRLVEVLRAAEVPADRRYDGPVAAIVDGFTASAAEMIAGALGAYGRGVVAGRRTFGKGCIQEYADDHVGRGVLRVTTLLFALPDGAAVQREGLVPELTLAVARGRDREADVKGALPAYVGPDVRDDRARAAWPLHGGSVGPCSDAAICAALAKLGAPRSERRATPVRRATARRPAPGSPGARL